MKINLLITGGLYDSQAAYSAWQFCQAALDQGHTVKQAFFYQAAAAIGTCLAEPLADEFDASSSWAELSQEYEIPLVVCVSAAERRGILSEEQQSELDKLTHNLHTSFIVEGLGSFYSACLDADRLVHFK